MVTVQGIVYITSKVVIDQFLERKNIIERHKLKIIKLIFNVLLMSFLFYFFKNLGKQKISSFKFDLTSYILGLYFSINVYGKKSVSFPIFLVKSFDRH